MKERLTKKFGIRVRHCDSRGKLALHELFKLMQECAVEHAHDLGVGMDQIAVTNKAFVLSRVLINIVEMPNLNDDIEITTYPVGIDKLFFIRDFEMHIGGRLFASARTLWLIIDLKTRRPDRNMARDVDFPYHYNESLGLTNPVKPGVPDECEPGFCTTVRYSDIDVLGHANNSSYIRWAGDCLGEDFFKNNQSYSITVNFNSEMKNGEQLNIFTDGSNLLGKTNEGRETFRILVEKK